MAMGEEIALIMGVGATIMATIITIIVHIRSRAFDAKYGVGREKG